MRNIKLTLQYDGANYHGWQRQHNAVSIQQVIENAILEIIQEKVSLKASGRTDAGVHALMQVANFKTNAKLEAEKIMKGLNSLLPNDIVILDARECHPDFNAQLFAKKKIYRYRIYNSQVPDVFLCKYSKFIPYPLNIKSMKLASECLIGSKDFSAFRSSSCEAKTTVREIFRIDFSREIINSYINKMEKGYFDPRVINIEVEGNGFLKNMVRNVAGTLIEVGREKINPNDVKEILDSRDRRNAGPTAAPHGLFLVKVFY